jgi:hypothetical protein
MWRPPTVTSIAPTSGPTQGGTAVTITGADFTGATAVTVSGTAASMQVVNATTITAVTPAHAAGVVDVAVTTPAGTGTGSGLYTYLAPPTVTSIAPNSGPTQGGTAVTITGTNFTSATAVMLGGTAATGVTVVNATTITAVTPAHAVGVVNVTVTTSGGAGTGSGLYTYVAPPTVASIAPNSGPTQGGTAITITGTNFTSATAVTLGGTAATGVTVVNATTITAVTPAHAAGLVNVTVTTPAGTGTGSGLYIYVAPPTVTSIAPNSGPTLGGTAVTITGTNYTSATTVTLGGTAATGVTVLNATTITAVTPAHAVGVINVTVTTSGGAGTGSGLYTYVAPPTVTSIAPNSGPTQGGTAVTITGTNFTSATAVTLGGTAATGVTVVNATTITAVTPGHAAGLVNVTVTTSGGAGTGSGLYTYVAPPTVTSIAPTIGLTLGGISVTITGTNFIGATAVILGGTAATGVRVVNATTITAVTPAHAVGVVNVTVDDIRRSWDRVGPLYLCGAPDRHVISRTTGPTQGSPPGPSGRALVHLSQQGPKLVGTFAVKAPNQGAFRCISEAIAFATFSQQRVGAVLIGAGGTFFSQRMAQLAALAARHALPAIYNFRAFVSAGGLMSHGSSRGYLQSQVGIYTGPLLSG